MIYINNASSVAINDVSIQDVLDAAFTYQADSIRIDNTVADCAPPVTRLEAQARLRCRSKILTAALSDGADATIPPATTCTSTVDAGDANVVEATPLDVAANTVLAVVFTATLD